MNTRNNDGWLRNYAMLAALFLAGCGGGTPGDYGYWPRTQDRVWTVGANFYTTPHVVFKADYQWFDLNSDFNRFDLGLGLNF